MATNAEAIIQGLRGIHDYEVALSIVGYINCPHTHNPDCKYDGKNSSLCDDCKIEWQKESEVEEE